MKDQVIIDYQKNTGRFLLQVPFHMNGIPKSMGGSRWQKRIKKWSVPSVRTNIETLQGLTGAIWTDAAQRAVEEKEKSLPRAVRLPFPDWYPHVLEPRGKQAEALDAGYGQREMAYFMKMGTGKSKVSIDLASIWYLEGKIERVLVVCPNSIKGNWGDQIAEHCPVEDRTVHLYSSSKKKLYDKWHEPTKKLMWCVVGIESFSQGRAPDVMFNFAICGKTLMIVDESSCIKNNSIRTSACIKIGMQCEKRLILTGTPITKNPLDLYYQFEFLNREILGFGDYWSFRNRYAVMGGYENKEVIGFTNMQELLSTITPFVFEADKPEGLPKKLPPQRRVVQASAEQKRILKDLAKGHAQIENVHLDIKNVLVKMLRMQQTVNGFFRETYEDTLTGNKVHRDRPLKSNPKITELRALLEETDDPALIWCTFHHDVRAVCEMMDKHFPDRSYVTYHGQMDDEEKEDARRIYEAGQADYFIGNPATGGIGLTLVHACLVVYYSNSYNLGIRLQSEDRAHRIGQTRDVTYVDLVVENTVDELAIEAIDNKAEMAAWVERKIREYGSSEALLNQLTGS